MSQKNNIEWVETSENVGEIYNSYIEPGSTDSDTILSPDISGAEQLGVRVRSISPYVANTFSTAFPEGKLGDNTPTLYHLDNLGADRISSICKTSKPAVGIYDESTGDIALFERDPMNYGLLNAIVLGLMSKLCMEKYGLYFAHAACLGFNGRSALIVGDHKAGKSTLVAQLLTEAEHQRGAEMSFASDDWVLLRQDKNGISALRLSQEYRIDRMIFAHPTIKLSQALARMAAQYSNGNSDKSSIPISELCRNMGCLDAQALPVDAVVILDPLHKDYCSKGEQANTMNIVSDSTANVPPLNTQQSKDNERFWENLFVAIGCHTINNRYKGVPIDRVAKDIMGKLQR